MSKKRQHVIERDRDVWAFLMDKKCNPRKYRKYESPIFICVRKR
jgi:hypothetical protein